MEIPQISMTIYSKNYGSVKAADLKIHAQRLEAIQHTLAKGVIPMRDETFTQNMFQHLLSTLIASFPNSENYRAMVGAGMETVNVEVKIASAFLKTPENSNMKKLHAKSDLTLVDLSLWNESEEASQEEDEANEDDDPQPQETQAQRKQQYFLRCLYSIELKDEGKLRNSSTSQKSQLLAESTARYLRLGNEGNCPKVLYSVLTDCYSLLALIHFTDEQKFLLSHREIEPGRIVLLLTWLYLIAKQGGSLHRQCFRGRMKFSYEYCIMYNTK